MATKEDHTEHEPLTEEQRITALEEKVGTNKIVLMGVALFLIIAVSVTSTFFVFSLFQEEPVQAESETVIALQAQVVELEKKIEELSKHAQTSKTTLSVVQEKLNNSSNIRLQQIILDQERGNQAFIDALRSGMYDLAHMLPGSRTWLEIYGEKVDKAERLSKEREKAILSLQQGVKSGPTIQEDPFADGF